MASSRSLRASLVNVRSMWLFAVTSVMNKRQIVAHLRRSAR
jgi:hypothetical protein